MLLAHRHSSSLVAAIFIVFTPNSRKVDFKIKTRDSLIVSMNSYSCSHIVSQNVDKIHIFCFLFLQSNLSWIRCIQKSYRNCKLSYSLGEQEEEKKNFEMLRVPGLRRYSEQPRKVLMNNNNNYYMAEWFRVLWLVNSRSVSSRTDL